MIITTSQNEVIKADKVILCMPPQVVHSEINFSPALPINLSDILPNVQTWMAGSIKFVLEYKKPFWRENAYSGMLYSHTGIVVEMYDHTNFEDNRFGFTGFLNSSFSSFSQEERRQLVLNQLAELLGEEIKNPTFYNDKVWTDEYTLGQNQVIQRRHYNNGHPLLQRSYYENKLYFSGTETSQTYPGYMEGAILSAIRIANEF